jgi:phage portal protein BeeE
MASILDRLFGVPQPAAKAMTGPGVLAWDYGVPLTSISRTPQKIAREAQAVYHNNPWAYLAENSVSGVAATVAFHIEDDAGNTIPDTHPVLVPLYRPNERMKRRWMTQLTLRHGGMCGDAFWYADALSGDGIPTGFYYINPARMWEAKDRAGNLTGWVMDADRPDGRQPVGFSVEEILHFVYDPADDGHRGVGIVEAAWRKLHLTEAADIHAEKSIRSGGRKPGIISPVDGKVFSDDEYKAIVNELRNVTDSPDAAKKSLIFKAPVDYKDAGIAPSQMQLADLMKSGRDDTLALWKVSLSQVGVVTARGLNSGETQKYEEASTWQNAREPRLSMFTETIQADYLDRFGFKLVLHLPTFDDQQPLYDLAKKSESIAMTNDERRALVGLQPLGPQSGGNLVYLPSTLVPIGTGPDNADEQIEAGGEVKAKLHFDGIRSKVERAQLPRLRAAMADVLQQQRAEIARRVTQHHAQIRAKPGDYSTWWVEAAEHRRLQSALLPIAEDIATEVGRATSATFFRPAKASLIDRVLEFVRHLTGIRIKGINDTTRDAVREVVEDGVRAGLSSAELTDRITGLGEFAPSRAEMIARTETGYALNHGALSTYREFDVSRVQVIDGDQDAECASANGAEWSLEEAESNPLSHPNCTRDFVPIVKAMVEPEPMQLMAESVKAVLERPLPAPVVNLYPEAPHVTVEAAKAPDVHVYPADAPVVNVAPPNVTVNVPKPGNRKVIRDESGQIIEIAED